MRPRPHLRLSALLALPLAGLLPLTAAAAPAGGSVEVSASADTTDGADASTDARGKRAAKEDGSTPWIKRYRPTRNSWELGIYLGLMAPSKRHEFYKADLTMPPDFAHKLYAPAGFDLGARVGYYPLSFLGLELEGGVIPTKVRDGSGRATLFTFRPVIVAQLPWRIAPFARAGFGMIGVSSAPEVQGKDIDPSFNIGGGVKFYVNRLVVLRLDIIDNVATAVGIGNDRSNNLEVLFGAGIRLGKTKEPPPRRRELIDSDGDGLYDPGQEGVPPEDEDACPQQPGPRENRGCPLLDSDSDTLYDPGQGGITPEQTDACPAQPGPVNNKGCPLIDSDGDTFYDPGQPVPEEKIDDCPSQPGPAEYKGCPDRDGDKIIDKKDLCPADPEDYNGKDDEDGCPDKVATFQGVLRGIYFDNDKDTIKPISRKVLDKAAAVLKEFPETNWEVSGHTDSNGAREHNMDLSERRAISVKNYLVEHGVDAKRITTVGYGPDQPIADNKTPRGRAMNRRIEFKLLNISE
ncbi:MAG: OmpA family protein [Nannocystaceae bacterium]